MSETNFRMFIPCDCSSYNKTYVKEAGKPFAKRQMWE